MFSENSRKQSSIYRQILGRQTKHVNMCIRGPVLGRKSIDLIIRKDSSERLVRHGESPASFTFSCIALAFVTPCAQRCPGLSAVAPA